MYIHGLPFTTLINKMIKEIENKLGLSCVKLGANLDLLCSDYINKYFLYLPFWFMNLILVL